MTNLLDAGQSSNVQKRKGYYILTRSGERFWPSDPRLEEIHIKDIAHSLSLQCRFSGHTKVPYSVAQHSLLVAEEVESKYDDKRLSRTALLHDASEAFLVDLPRPIKSMGQLGEEYRKIEDKIQKVISKKFDLIYPFPDEVMHEDLVLLVTEARDLMAHPKGEGKWFDIDPLPQKIVPMDWQESKRLFLKKFKEYTDVS